MAPQHKMSIRRALPAHGVPWYLPCGCPGPAAADGCAGSCVPVVGTAPAPAVPPFPGCSSISSRYREPRPTPAVAPACVMMAIVTDDPFAAAVASAARLTDRTGPPDVAVILGSGWAAAADAIGAASTEIPLAE